MKKNYTLTKEEISEAKKNGFILIGKTGVGKTSLLNVIYGSEIGKVGYDLNSTTNSSNYYCIKKKIIENKYIYFCLIDTPGLCNTYTEKNEKNQLENIKNLISKENIQIKGLLYLSNFQNERFDASEQEAFIQYNELFPLKDFWKRIILVFTHYYGDIDGDSEEEIKERKNELLSLILNRIMLKLKKISTPVEYNTIKCKYYNIYSRIKNEKQIKNNEFIMNDIINEFLNYIKLKPLFSKIRIVNFENYSNKNDNYLYNGQITFYQDLQENIINSTIENIKKFKKNNTIKSSKISICIKTYERDKNNNVIIKESKIDENSIWNNVYLFFSNIINKIVGIIGYKICFDEIISNNEIKEKEKEKANNLIDQFINKNLSLLN